MKSFYSLRLILLATLLVCANAGVFAQATTSFAYTGAPQVYNVPSGVTTIYVDAVGARGGTSTTGQRGGYGGRTQAVLSVTPLSTIYIYVGGTGSNGVTQTIVNAGFNDSGANGGYCSLICCYGGGGGGGGTDIRVGGTTLANRVIVAGAGGGGACNCTNPGGNGGGLTGQTAPSCSSEYCGQGGSQTSGGASGTFSIYGTSGGGAFGWGGIASTAPYQTYGGAGGGGGGGWYGGAGGSWGGGGGGSSYTSTTLVSSVTHTQGYNTTGPAYVNLTPIIPTIIDSPGTTLAFPPTVVGATSSPLTFYVGGGALTPTSGSLTVTPPPGFQIWNGSTWITTPITLSYTTQTFSAIGNPVQIRFAPTAYSTYSNSVTITGGGASTTYQLVTGNGIPLCTGAPVATTAAVSPTSGGLGTAFTLSLSPAPTSGGFTYQWYEYNDGVGGLGFYPIPAATTSTYTVGGISTTSYFYCVVTCSGSGLSTASSLTMASFSPISACSGLPTAGTIYATTNTGCAPSYSPMLSLVGAQVGPDITYSWKVSNTGPTTGFSVISTATNPFYSPTVSNTIWVQAIVTCNEGANPSRATPVIQLTLNSLPGAISGYPTVCLGTPTAFTDTTAGGTWTSTNNSIVTIGLGSGIANGVSPGAASVCYTKTATGCSVCQNVSVNPALPVITGPTSVCVSSTIPLSDLITGGTWSSSASAFATVNSTSGVVSGVAAGSAVISYKVPSGCFVTYPIAVNPVPAAISGSGQVCVGATNVLSDATFGGTWVSNDVFEASVGSSSGIVSGVATGVTAIRYVLSTGCSASLATSVNSNPVAISGVPAVCANVPSTFSDGSTGGGWSSSNPLILTVDPVLGVVTGITGGTATVMYTIAATGCMASYPVLVNAQPNVQTATVTDGGGYCPGGTGVHIGLNGSATGVQYNLFMEGSGTSLLALTGSLTSLDFGLYTTGSYFVTATNLSTGCTDTMRDTVNVFNYVPPTTYTVTGGGSYCSGGAGMPIDLSGSDYGVKYELLVGGVPAGPLVTGSGSPLVFGPETASGDYTVVAQDPSTLCISYMAGDENIYIINNPPVDTVYGGGGYCAGSAGAVIWLENSYGGLKYRFYDNGVLVDSVYGISGPDTLYNVLDSGLYTVTASDYTTGCTDNMWGSARVTVNPLPQQYDVTGGGSYCIGTAGRYVNLDYSVIGTNYILYNALGPVDTVAGANSGIDFGQQTVTSPYFVIGQVASTGCSDTMIGTVNVVGNLPPDAFTVNVSGSGSYCQGTSGLDVTLLGSDPGINFKYQLYLNGVPLGSAKLGTGMPLDFGNQMGVGAYTVIAENTSTLCSTTMTGAPTISVDSLPYLYSVSGGGNYCAGGAGVNVNLSNSQSGITYTPMNGGVAYTSQNGGTGALVFPETVAGVYTIVAQNTVTTCSVTMTGSAPVGINPLPGVYAVSGGGGYCQGGTGMPVGMSNTNFGIKYQLYNDGSPVGSALSGTGSMLPFGIFSDTGTYTIIATNTSTTCMDTMSGSAVVTVHAMPLVFTVTGGGSFCAGSTGQHVYLDSTEGATAGITYYLYDGGTLMDSHAGIGHLFDFGAYNVPGTYKVVAKSSFGCMDTMTSSALLVSNPLPTVYSVSGGGSYCAGDTGVHVFLSGSNTYVNYTVKDGTDTVGTFWAGTGLPLDLGLDTAPGTYTIIATSVTDFCSSNMSGTATINIIPSVTPAVTISTPAADTLCAGAVVYFTATGTNTGALPVYQWKVNGMLMSTGTTYNYIPLTGDSVSVVLNSSATCAVPASVSTYSKFDMLPVESPAVTIAPNITNSCPGTAVTFTAAPTNGGTVPGYSWKVNGVARGTSSATYTYTPADSDVVFVVMTSTYACPSTDLALSNVEVVNVNQPPTPIINISNNPLTAFIAGETITLTANIPNGDTDLLTYQWAVNNINVPGATNAAFTSSSLKNGDIVCATAESHNVCGASAPATQCETMVIYGNTGVQQPGIAGAELRVIPNPNNGSFSLRGAIGSLAAVGAQDISYEVTNVLGQVLYSGAGTVHNGVVDESISLSNVANGMYLLSVHSGEEVVVYHFVVAQ